MSSQKWYVKTDKGVQGPFSPVQIRQREETGEITPESQLRLGDSGRWDRADKIPGLFGPAVAGTQSTGSAKPVSAERSQSPSALANPGKQPPAIESEAVDRPLPDRDTVPTRPTGPIDDEPWRPEPADLNITSVSAVPAADFVTESIDQVAGKAPTPGGQGHLVRSAAIATIFFGVGTGVGCLASRLLASRPEPPKYVAANTTNGNQAQPRQDGAAEGDLAQPNAWADVGKGTYHLQRREFDEAIKNFSHAIEVNPKFEYAYHRRGWCYFEQQRHDKAADDFAKASQLGPAVTSYRLDQAFAQISGKKYDQAIDVLTNLIAEQDDNMDALRMRSEAYQLSGRQEKADEDLLVIRRLRNKETSRDKDGAKDAPTVKVANDLPAAESAEPGTPASTPRPNKPRVRKGAEDREKTAKTSPSAKGNSEKLESEKREADDQPK